MQFLFYNNTLPLPCNLYFRALLTALFLVPHPSLCISFDSLVQSLHLPSCSGPPVSIFLMPLSPRTTDWPSERKLSSSVILASLSSSSWVSGRSQWGPFRRRDWPCLSCTRRNVCRVCSAVDWRIDFRPGKEVREEEIFEFMSTSFIYLFSKF